MHNLRENVIALEQCRDLTFGNRPSITEIRPLAHRIGVKMLYDLFRRDLFTRSRYRAQNGEQSNALTQFLTLARKFDCCATCKLRPLAAGEIGDRQQQLPIYSQSIVE